MTETVLPLVEHYFSPMLIATGLDVSDIISEIETIFTLTEETDYISVRDEDIRLEPETKVHITIQRFIAPGSPGFEWLVMPPETPISSYIPPMNIRFRAQSENTFTLTDENSVVEAFIDYDISTEYEDEDEDISYLTTFKVEVPHAVFYSYRQLFLPRNVSRNTQ